MGCVGTAFGVFVLTVSKKGSKAPTPSTSTAILVWPPATVVAAVCVGFAVATLTTCTGALVRVPSVATIPSPASEPNWNLGTVNVTLHPPVVCTTLVAGGAATGVPFSTNWIETDGAGEPA